MTYRNQKVHDLINDTDISWNVFLDYLQSSNYFNLFNIMEEQERRLFINKMCSDLAVICEKYSKALYLKTATIPESIITSHNLTDDDVVDIIIGSDNSRYSELTREEKREIQELKFQGISHKFTKLFNNENQFLKNVQFFFNKSIKELKNVPDSDLEEVLFSEKVYEAFVKGRYSGLNDFNADFDALITLCETLQELLLRGEAFFDMDCVEILPNSSFDLLSDFYNYKESIEGHTSIYGGLQPRLRKIKHIFPVLESKISIDNNGEEKEYYYGKHKSVSLYRFESQNGVNQRVKKSKEELDKDNEKAPTMIGLYSANEGAKDFVELNSAFNMSGLVIEDGSTVDFEDNNGHHTIINIGGKLVLSNRELLKNNSNKKAVK